ncbi:DNA polymerase epsilon subunit C-like [Stylophora pistillata]|uniref:Dr1-associated corepressor n=1 Tax=Stylophora pistillata TaxID=50429 RepID=A0A2B4SA05_STYPI|nr:DNA polymerase epsilon subunit C-like [Stylophora pistillata]PFX25417.1 Dr1-associated corepressor [Stylophora pistillata]
MMPSKKKKFNARFPPARIKKIMQTDEDVGKVAAAVPVIISKALEMFVQSLVERASDYTKARNAKTMTTSHLKRCITSENQFDFLKDLVANVPDLPSNEEEKDGEPKPKRKRMPKPPAQNKEKKKSEKKKPQAATVSDESDEELESEEEDSSSEGTSNHNNIIPAPAVPSLTITRPSTEQTEESESSLPVNIPKLNQMSGIMGSSLDEDDDYDS